MFNEANSVDKFIRDLLAGTQSAPKRPGVGEIRTGYDGMGWQFVPGNALQRQISDVLVEPELRAALSRLNPEIAEDASRADEVFYKLRAILLSVRGEGLVRANELFTEWLRGEKTLSFGPNGQHTTVRLIDFDDPTNNTYIVATQVTYGPPEKRFDLVLYVNGIPLVVGESKTPVRPAISWVDGAHDIQNYEKEVPAFFVPTIFSFATEGKTYRYGSIGMPLDIWAPWREREDGVSGLDEVEKAIRGMLTPTVMLDILRHFTLFATDKKHRKIKVICRYQQYHTVNQIIERVAEGIIKKGLIWHFQGSGKSLLMVFAAQKLRLTRALKNPTVLIVVDRIDLDTQISATFNAADVPNTVPAPTRDELRNLLSQDTRKVIITTIHKFAEAPGVLNTRDNIIVMVDEAHRTQEGDLGRKMREALPNAFLFGLTGTPINNRDRNTFWTFGAPEDTHGYMSRYGLEEAIRDKATLPLHFEPRLVRLHVDKAAIDEAYAAITGHLSEEDQANLAKQAARIAVLVKSPERIATIVQDIVTHFQEKIDPNGFKAQIVTFDRESCVLYKQALDKLLPPEASDIVMTVASDEPDFRRYKRSRNDEEKLLDRFRDPSDPLKFLIVTSKLLTGFDAPILQAMYLDKPMKEHSLLQGICRTNRPYTGKTHGLIVDYLGIFDDVAMALAFDEQSIQHAISNLDMLKAQLPSAMAKCEGYFPNVDRTIAGYEGLLAAQECLPTNDQRDAFAKDYSVLAQLWEALSPDSVLVPYTNAYRWLSQVYESVKPPSGHGKLLWHVLGAKTLELIHENIHVITIQDDLDTLIMDVDFLEDIVVNQDLTKGKELQIKISTRLRRHKDTPVFVELGRRLEELRDRHERGMIQSVDFLKDLLEIARAVVAAEKTADPVEEQDRGKAALTELFSEVRNASTPIIVERVVNNIDEIVRIVRFDGWQQTNAGTKEVKKALRQTLLKYQLHKENELFDKAYAYIEQYY